MKATKKMGKFLLKMQDNQNFEKHACQNMVAMETPNCLHQDTSYRNDCTGSEARPIKIFPHSEFVLSFDSLLHLDMQIERILSEYEQLPVFREITI